MPTHNVPYLLLHLTAALARTRAFFCFDSMRPIDYSSALRERVFQAGPMKKRHV